MVKVTGMTGKGKPELVVKVTGMTGKGKPELVVEVTGICRDNTM